MTTDKKGNIAEAAIQLAATKLGIDVYRPVGEGGRYDLILEIDDRLWRVQCKWAPREGEVVIVRCYSSRRVRDGFLERRYEPGEVDAFAAYCSELDKCYFLPYELFQRRTGISLRLGPTHNNQARGVNWAKDFEFEATLSSVGAVAQLGERRAGSA